MEMNKIKEMVEKLGFGKKEMFTLDELEQISEMSGVRVIDVMVYLRSREVVK